ncbi:MFS transporter [Sulfitobacter sp. D35]|uniref:MFS transporter n=1 Tax=Sulfitobacter sp. D35 TaxID=3083252 RepID=UPI00296EC0D9|nr:MFS transporter [Sulfitobacter sp. D35]MDW4496726.1 MFS transporter [Sulfitobacter sp. D35]
MHKLRSPWAAVSAAFFFNGALFGVWASRIPAFVARLELEPDTLGLLLLMLAGGAIASFPFAGTLTDRLGAWRLTRWLAAWYALTLVLLAFAPSVWVLALLLFLFGIGHGGMDVAMNAWAAEVERALARPVMSTFHAMFSLGAGIGALSGYLAALGDMSVAMHFTLASVGLAVVTAWMTARPWAGRATPHSGAVFALPRKSLLIVGLVAFATCVGEGAMADWSAVYLDTVLETTKAQAALGYAVFSVAMVAVRLSGSFLIAAIGPVLAARLSGACALVGALVVVAASGLAVALVGFALLGVGYAVIMPLAFSRAAADPEVPPGQAIASVATLSYGGMLLGPPMIGFLAHLTDLPTAFLMLSALALVTIVFGSVLSLRN